MNESITVGSDIGGEITIVCWYCDQCHVAVKDKERCKHCGKTEEEEK